ncbi:hypothetical protein [Pseudomarimonas arenosa]|uniref:Ubiquitin-like domain-containing protein n=1 Tax=Pseudomarimonas arenosa TaxID=2774145 RepID=A0AAW3ZDV9_9GAMM|nr:hypothetical protein [Pseudomarimonas arenosa]MBD8524356.1 hypothetical protein [Pseudomarimonas arenosa]
MTIRVYVQSEYLSDVQFVEVDDDATLHDLNGAALELLPAGTDVSELSLSIEDDQYDDEEADRPEVTHVRDLKKGHGIRIHLHRCKHVEVYVRFANETVHRKFRPATTVGRVRNWAGRKLGMEPGDIAEHVLQVAGTTEQPDVDVHIGTLARCPQCSLTFDLVPAHRING